MRRLILFVHGLGGSANGTWGAFGPLIESHPGLEGWAVRFHDFPTNVFRLNPLKNISLTIEQLADDLDTKIRAAYAEYDEIMIVAHSMGGVIARKYFVERLKMAPDSPVKTLLLFATPHEGADIAKWGTLISVQHQHLAQLRRKSAFLDQLNLDWARMHCADKVRAVHVSGGQDRIVPLRSSRATWTAAASETIGHATHTDIVKPTSTEDLSFKLMLREAQALAGGQDEPLTALKVAPVKAGAGNPLFNLYTPADEIYYVPRGEDGQLSPAVKYRHIWLVGPIGCGKTACATRALDQSVGRYATISLAIAAGGTAPDLLAALHVRLARLTGATEAHGSDVVDAIADRLGEAADQGVQAVLLEEIPLKDEAMQAFFNSVTAIVVRQAAEAKGVPVRLVFTSAIDPGAAFSGNSHAAEVLSVVRIGTWREGDLKRLIDTIAAALPFELSEQEAGELLSSCGASPRFVKMHLSTMLTLPETPDRFAHALAATRESMSR